MPPHQQVLLRGRAREAERRTCHPCTAVRLRSPPPATYRHGRSWRRTADVEPALQLRGAPLERRHGLVELGQSEPAFNAVDDAVVVDGGRVATPGADGRSHLNRNNMTPAAPACATFIEEHERCHIVPSAIGKDGREVRFEPGIALADLILHGNPQLARCNLVITVHIVVLVRYHHSEGRKCGSRDISVYRGEGNVLRSTTVVAAGPEICVIHRRVVSDYVGPRVRRITVTGHAFGIDLPRDSRDR